MSVAPSIPILPMSPPTNEDAVNKQSVRKVMSVSNLLNTDAPAPGLDTGSSNPTDNHEAISQEPSTPVMRKSLPDVATILRGMMEEPTPAAPFNPPEQVPPQLNEVILEEDTAMDDAPDSVSTDAHLDEEDQLSSREFICMNDEFATCLTKQYKLELSRKVISDHFGRNKACTRYIVDWPLFCRKHYQRATYDKSKWQLRKVNLILRQLDKIEEQFPGTTYGIQFKKSEETRLNQFTRHFAGNGDLEEAKQRAAASNTNGKNYESPIDILLELDQYTGTAKTKEEVADIVDVIKQMLEEKEVDQVPSIEFLPQIPGHLLTPSPKKASVSTTPKTPKTPKTPSRVSGKGAIKKITMT